MDYNNLIGTMEPLADDVNNMFGWHISGEWLKLTGLVVTDTHPTSITVTDTSITFDYTVGGKPVSRAYALTKADGKITSFTNPDGSVTEVLRDG